MTETTNNILGENMLPLAEIAKPVFNITALDPRIGLGERSVSAHLSTPQ